MGQRGNRNMLSGAHRKGERNSGLSGGPEPEQRCLFGCLSGGLGVGDLPLVAHGCAAPLA
jgi:hypothetical protein